MSYSVFQGRLGQGQEHAREQALSDCEFAVLKTHAVSKSNEPDPRE
jgi:hypothetical protein